MLNRLYSVKKLGLPSAKITNRTIVASRTLKSLRRSRLAAIRRAEPGAPGCPQAPPQVPWRPARRVLSSSRAASTVLSMVRVTAPGPCQDAHRGRLGRRWSNAGPVPGHSVEVSVAAADCWSATGRGQGRDTPQPERDRVQDIDNRSGGGNDIALVKPGVRIGEAGVRPVSPDRSTCPARRRSPGPEATAAVSALRPPAPHGATGEAPAAPQPIVAAADVSPGGRAPPSTPTTRPGRGPRAAPGVARLIAHQSRVVGSAAMRAMSAS